MKITEELITQLKSRERNNYFFMRRRVDKGNGKKTLGWMLRKEDEEKTYENKDFYKLKEMVREK